MQKKITLFIIFLMTIVLCGCDSEKNTIMTIKLEGNPTTGYEWNCKSSNEDVINQSENLYTPNSNEEGKTGVGGIYTFSFKAIKEGMSTISCNYKRSWEENSDDINVEYDVKIDSNQNIELISKSGTLQEIPVPIFE